MSITYSFVDGFVYGTEDINDIARSIVGAGVAPFLSKDSYNVSDLNAVTSALVTEGVQLDGCKVSMQNPAEENMTATVSQGIVFFESGVRLVVDGDGYIIKITPNTAGSIFAHYNPALQKADILFAAALPTDGECVLLAEVSNSGKVIDKRQFARSKVATLGKNVKLTPSFSMVEPEQLSMSDNYASYIIAKAPVIDLSQFNYALIYSNISDSYEMLDLAQENSRIYLDKMYNYGPENYAQVVNGRLCVVQVGLPREVPYGISTNMFQYYKIILV